MPASFLRLLFLTAASALAALPASARADETEGARLFREGRSLMLSERFAEACPKLEQSQRLEPRGGTLLNVAACHERIGRIGTAWVEFHDAEVAARTEGHSDRARLAAQRLAALEPRLPWLTVTVTPEAEAQGVRVTFDGAELARIAWGKEMPIDPGEHVLMVTADGRVEHARRLIARESERQSVEVTALAAVPPPAPAPGPPVVEAAPEPPPVDPAPPLVRAPRFGRWVFEAGLFAAYLNGSMERARLDGDESGVLLGSNEPGNSMTSSCASVTCSYSLGRRGSLAGGVNLFAGFAASDWIHVGGRMLAGPRLRGGMIFATGPSVSMHMWGPLWVGASLYLGYASQSESSGTVTPPPSHYLTTADRFAITASTDVAFGAGFELRAELFRTAAGALSVDTQPFFLSGSPGSAFVLPIGVSYRWR